ncbi:MAG: nucleotide-diphospho-sugar transferase, partial [Actinobacteria bacterium]|nr:nucleotide-diphospho-sugar transferase [Actinomycetota bacterium]
MRTTPLLLLAYNRPDKVRRLIDRLRTQRPMTIMVAVDGPKPGSPGDEAKVQAVRDAVSEIDWTDDVDTLFRPVNLGLRKAVAGAVSWALEKHGEVIVLEEDVLPGELFVPYMTRMLDRFR